MQRKVDYVELVCDRCLAKGVRRQEGAFFYSGAEMEVKEWDESRGHGTRAVDLCGPCYHAFRKFIEGPVKP